MAQASLRCPKCQKTMEEGHLPDIGHGSVTRGVWSPGPGERGFFGGIKLKRKEQIALSAYRCPGCGYVEIYAS